MRAKFTLEIQTRVIFFYIFIRILSEVILKQIKSIVSALSNSVCFLKERKLKPFYSIKKDLIKTFFILRDSIASKES
jgi:hypothetical protein